MFKNRWNIDSKYSFVHSHLIAYPTPYNLNYMWGFGSSAGICLVVQIVTGIFLAMHYNPDVNLAFGSVQHIMNDVNYGWLIRYIHANGASMFFILVYFHIFRGIYYGSYTFPRNHLWKTGIIIFFLMMATAFIGYVLPWGQMSLWGVTVITNLFSAIPFIGSSIVEWLWGGFSVSNATLNRFFSLHYLLPFLIVGMVFTHLGFLHQKGSNNPLGITPKFNVISFYPYFWVKDVIGFLIFIGILSLFVFFYPNALGHPDNYIAANPVSTPAHIVPEWYFLPYYAILRSFPSKLGGVLAMIISIAILFFLPELNTCITANIYKRPLFRVAFWILIADFLFLGWIGQQPVESPYTEVGMFATFFYFFFWLIIFPEIGKFENKILLQGHASNSLENEYKE
jgi:ubiquinol-cytochrome c reductase cytochrome b subunit